MATELKPVTVRFNRPLGLTRFHGGMDGPCLQLTPTRPDRDYFAVTKEQALELAIALIEFANGTRAEQED